MALFPQSFLEDLRQQADIVQVVQETVSLRRVGSRYTGLCPFHSEKTPSFGVDRERGLFHCFGCGVGGNVFSSWSCRSASASPRRCARARPKVRRRDPRGERRAP